MTSYTFTLYTADLEDWLKFTKLFGYADDISTSVSGKNVEEILRNLKEDSDRILLYMAANLYL